MTTLQQLLDQQAELNQKIAAIRVAARAKAISEVQALLAQHGLTVADISMTSSGQRKGGSNTSGKKVAAKYRHPPTGATWTGRGLKPKWMVQELATGKTLSDFAI